MPQIANDISRREFLNLTGGAAGLAAFASLGMASGWAANKRTVDTKHFSNTITETDVLVIGGGIAGLFAAVKAHDAGAKVMLVSKGRLGASGETPFAKGMFCFDPTKSKVSLEEFTAMISRSALGTNNPVYTRQMAEHSLARINELKQWGFFDSALCNSSFSKPINTRNIPLIERVMITHLIKEEGRIAGAMGFSLDDQTVCAFRAKSVILCTGAGGFKPNGFPICDLTHDGTVMAYNIGAKVTGKEWNDGHSGQTENAADCYNGWHGMFDRKPSTIGVEVVHQLGVDGNYMAYMDGNPMQMGPGADKKKTVKGGPYVPEEFEQSGGPGGPPGGDSNGPPRGGPGGPPGGGPGGGPPGGGKDRSGKASGGPPGMMGASVGGSSAGMSIHKSEGLVPINDKCESNIRGLYAAGDALGSHMSGGIYTQGGSSLTGSGVQGAIAGQAAAEYAKSVALANVSGSRLKAIKKEMLAPLNRKAGYGPAWVTQTLQSIMIPNFVLYIKKESMLKAALAYVEELRNHHMPQLRAADVHELRLAHETANMIISAEMKLKASLMRKESRCSHFRLDYPKLDNNNWQAWINIYKGANGKMQLEKQPFDSWPKQQS
jgi:succinate dehydrogenase/fumarate reductase flavoprotein subunit